MKRLTLVALLLAVCSVAVLALGAKEKDKVTAMEPKATNTDKMMSVESAEPNPDKMMSMAADGSKMGIGGKIEFTDLAAAGKLTKQGPVVLFFYATWCPTCRTAMQDIDAHLSRLGNVTVVIVDYDREAALKKKYTITYQHTFVQIDAAGGKLAVWNGGGVDSILEHVTMNKEG